MKYRLIKAEKAITPLKVSCEVLGVSRSGYYAWEGRGPSERQRSDEKLLEQIREIYAANELVYGSPRIHAELRMEYGVRVGRKRVERLMRVNGISGLIEKKRGNTTVRVPGVKVASDKVLRDFTAKKPNQLWVADITYLRTWEGWVYLAAVQDAYSRRIVGWSMAEHMRTDLVVDALKMAVKRRRPDPGVIHHSDRGSQYVSLAFGKVAKKNGIAQSMGQVGSAYDNSLAESFFATLKKEKVYRRSWPDKQELKTHVFEYIESFYNRRRRHSYLGYLAPAEFEGEARLPLKKAA
ncbi:MAG: IS3 family transposase [Solirubrobacterales bacterium]|nr:IS3 family transposase [Solirubrobacterales bacterium]